MPGKGFQPEVVQAQIEPTGEFDRAHRGVDGQNRVGQFGFRGQERVVEGGVVGYQGASVHQCREVVGDIGKRRLILEHL